MILFAINMSALLMAGCGNQATQEVAESTVEASESTKEETAKSSEEQTVTEEVAEEPDEENAQTESAEQETQTEDRPEAQIAITVSDFNEFMKYAQEIDKEAPALLIYNEEEGYVINMGEGEYYQIKKGDRFFQVTTEKCTEAGWTLSDDPGKFLCGGIWEMTPNYSDCEGVFEVRYLVRFSEEDYKLLTCYMSAPEE